MVPMAWSLSIFSTICLINVLYCPDDLRPGRPVYMAAWSGNVVSENQESVLPSYLLLLWPNTPVPINAPKSGKRMELVNHDWEPRAPSPFCIWENRSPISTSFEINRSNGDSITYPDFFVGAMETPLHDLILFCKWCSNRCARDKRLYKV